MTVINDPPLPRSGRWCRSPAWTLSPRIGRAEPALCICSCPSGEYGPPGATNKHACFKGSREEAAHLYSRSLRLPVLSAHPGRPWWTHCHLWGRLFPAFPASRLTGTCRLLYGHYKGPFNIKAKWEKKPQTQVGSRCTGDSPSTSWPSWVRHTQEVGVRTSSTNIYGGIKPAWLQPRAAVQCSWSWRCRYLWVVVFASLEISVDEPNLQISLKPRRRSWWFPCFFLWMFFSIKASTNVCYCPD